MSGMFSREDWTLFRSLNTLGQKAGVPVRQLGALVIKELVDNALDAGAKVSVTEEDGGWIVIADNGPGIDHEMVATLFSIRRPLTSSKIVRLPMRGALGNGLRVVMGAVYASQGEISVETGTQDDMMTIFTLQPEDNGHTTVVSTRGGTHYKGTKIRIKLGPAIINNEHSLLSLAKFSLTFAEAGKHYTGQTSPWWYDGEAFFEMCQAAGETSMPNILRLFRDIKPDLAQDLSESFGFKRAHDCGKAASGEFLQAIRKYSKEPKPNVLGSMGEFLNEYRTAKMGVIEAGQHPMAHIPYVVEVLCSPLSDEIQTKVGKNDDSVLVMVNRTLITGSIRSYRTKATELGMWGCGLGHVFNVPRGIPVRLIINITTPYMPITTDGKEPDLKRFIIPLIEAVESAARKCKRDNRKAVDGVKRSQRDVIIDNLQEAIDKASSHGKYRFSLRNLFYAVRPFLLEHGFEQGLDYNYFGSVITQVESDQGHDIVGMYRDPRGKIYHPHTREEIALGTVAVEEYKRPAWTFNKILYIEKGGFFPLLQDVEWPERNDCALVTSQGFASRAVRDVLDLLGETDEDIYFFCIHDADASGTMIYQSLLEATKAREARKVHIINLGLDPQEALEMGLQVETGFRKDGDRRKLPTASYLGYADSEWLQTNRVELNAMTSEEFLTWLDAKFAEYAGKIIPPVKVMGDTYEQQAKDALTRHLTAKILEEGNLVGRHTALAEEVVYTEEFLTTTVTLGLEDHPEHRWDKPLEETADSVAAGLVLNEKPKKKGKA